MLINYAVRSAVLTASSSSALQVLQSMSPVKWDIKEIMSQHSSYVDRLLQVWVMVAAGCAASAEGVLCF